jgi:hypothetical protein
MELLPAVRNTSLRVANRRSCIIPARARLTTTAFLMPITTAAVRRATTVPSEDHTRKGVRYPTTLLSATIDMG